MMSLRPVPLLNFLVRRLGSPMDEIAWENA